MAQVMLVDDQPHILRVLRFTLERHGHVVSSAFDGVEALEVLERGLPDIVVTDVMMPRMTGRELCEAIHARFAGRVPPILVMTSLTDRGEREWVKRLPGVEFLEKPVSPRHVAERVAALCSKAEPHD